jgi:catechol 2,3-dioxygenase-like lactoylglutathione lyase family enzyme
MVNLFYITTEEFCETEKLMLTERIYIKGRRIYMKHTCMVISVADIALARKFYEDLFGLELYQDYGINISFTCGLSLQQDFDWLVNIPKDKIIQKSNNMEICFEEQDFDNFLNKLNSYSGIEYLGDVIEHSWGQRVVRFYDLDGHIIEVGEDMKMVINRFLSAGMTMAEISVKMDASIEDLTKLLNS